MNSTVAGSRLFNMSSNGSTNLSGISKITEMGTYTFIITIFKFFFLFAFAFANSGWKDDFIKLLLYVVMFHG